MDILFLWDVSFAFTSTNITVRKEFKFELVTFNDSLMTLSNEQSALSCDYGMLIAHSHNPLQNLYNY